MSPEARESSFDELARGLASGRLSRRKALRLMGVALLGGVMASIPGAALAAPPIRGCQTVQCPLGSRCCEKGSGRSTICCPNETVCCIVRGRLTCTSTVETCKMFHGHVARLR
jgi:hypothetical protein